MDDFQMNQAEQQVQAQQQQAQAQQQQVQAQQQAQAQAQQEQQTWEQQVHRHLVELQNWDRTEDQTIEQRRMEQNEFLINMELDRNADTKNEWREKVRKIEADRTAAGRPVQLQQPAEKTFKQRREDKRLDSKAKKSTPLADHISIRIVEGLQKKKRMQDNSLTSEVTAAANVQHVDSRVLRSFSYGYEINKDGEPADEQQQNRKELDQQFFADYISKDAQRRKPHLDRMLEQVLSTDITEEMFEPAYMEFHARELHEQITRLVYFENVYQDPVNREYFAALPQVKRDLIQCKVLDRYALYGSLFTHVCALRGLQSDTAVMNKHDNEEDVQTAREAFGQTVEDEKQQLREILTEGRSRERMLLQNEYERMCEAERERLMRGGEEMKQMVEQQQMKTDKGADMTNLNLTGFVTGYSFDELAKYRKMIEDHPEEYKQRQGLVDTLYQQMYRSIDALGDLTLDAMVSQGVMDELNETMPQRSKFKSTLQKKAMIDQQEIDLRATVVRRQISGMGDALSMLLAHKPLTQYAKQILGQYGYWLG